MAKTLNILYTSDPKDMYEVDREHLVELIRLYDGVYDIRGLAECAIDNIPAGKERLHIFTDLERKLAGVA